MLETINIRSKTPAYIQIENLIRFAIASRRLKGGDQLPAIAELAERVGVNPNTVTKSYRDLEVMGYIRTRRGMGVFVKEGCEEKCRRECMASIIQGFYVVVAEAKTAGLTASQVREFARQCFKSDASPYDDVPPEILGLARGLAASRK